MQKRYCTIKELAEYTGCPTGTLYEWTALGVIPSIKIRRRILFDLDDIDQILSENKQGSKSEIIASTVRSRYPVKDSGQPDAVKPRRGG